MERIFPEGPLDTQSLECVQLEDGTEIPVRLRLLDYSECEFECDEPIEPGSLVIIHLFRMGWIRARILTSRPGVVKAEFLKDCPV